MAIDPEVAEAINLLWILVAAIICFFLQAGFGVMEVGAIRAKNAQSVMIKNLMDACVAAIGRCHLSASLCTN
jgi:Amt family ammonium transporter